MLSFKDIKMTGNKVKKKFMDRKFLNIV